MYYSKKRPGYLIRVSLPRFYKYSNGSFEAYHPIHVTTILAWLSILPGSKPPRPLKFPNITKMTHYITQNAKGLTTLETPLFSKDLLSDNPNGV